MSSANSTVTVSTNPLVADSLFHLRNERTETPKFRYHSDKVCQLLFSEALQGLELTSLPVTTPLTDTHGSKLLTDIVIIPVLRAGIAMLFAALQMLPKTKVGFVGMQRDETTAVASEYYWKLPPITSETVVIITDPMLATGGSLIHVLERISPMRPKEIRAVCVISAPEGIAAVVEKYPEVRIFTSAVDERLNDKKYIVPGLGDYGDRYFGTT